LPRTDEGEFELILGNRQLISVFLIVVILLGVFFSMGYIVGRNSAPVAIETRNTQPTKPIVVEPPARNKDADQPAPIEPATQATAPPPAAEKKEAMRPPPVAAPAPEKKQPVPVEPAANATEQPPSGRYWQVVSTGRHEAEIVSGAIAKKGMKSLVAPAPKEGYFRVLVGPLGDAADVARTRADLEAAGFKNPVLAHY
jgi:cell division protein FtsN